MGLAPSLAPLPLRIAVTPGRLDRYDFVPSVNGTEDKSSLKLRQTRTGIHVLCGWNGLKKSLRAGERGIRIGKQVTVAQTALRIGVKADARAASRKYFDYFGAGIGISTSNRTKSIPFSVNA